MKAKSNPHGNIIKLFWSLIIFPSFSLSTFFSLASLLITAANSEAVNLSGEAFIAALLPSHYTVIIAAVGGL